MDAQQLIEIYEDTQAQVNSGRFATLPFTSKYEAEEFGRVFLASGATTLLLGETVVSVVNLDSVSAAQILCQAGKTAVLNMASPTRPGGGVANGAKAQEECLFRCSDLFNTVTKDFYPLGESEVLYTFNVTFFKGVNYDPIEPFRADVITAAAVNLNKDHHAEAADLADYEAYVLKTRKKIRLMFRVAKISGAENLVLGAWGCGVFKNKPEVIAQLFVEELRKVKGWFKQVQFAVINDHNSVANNYEIFKEIINTYPS